MYHWSDHRLRSTSINLAAHTSDLHAVNAARAARRCAACCKFAGEAMTHRHNGCRSSPYCLLKVDRRQQARFYCCIHGRAILLVPTGPKHVGLRIDRTQSPIGTVCSTCWSAADSTAVLLYCRHQEVVTRVSLGAAQVGLYCDIEALPMFRCWRRQQQNELPKHGAQTGHSLDRARIEECTAGRPYITILI